MKKETDECLLLSSWYGQIKWILSLEEESSHTCPTQKVQYKAR